MPFITQGKINLKYILIVIVLAIIVGGGIYWLNRISPEVPRGVPTGTPIEPVGEPEELSFQRVELHPDWRLRQSFDYSTYRGIFRTESELQKIWKHMVNAYDEVSGLPFPKSPNQPVLPNIDFGKYSVIWYADRGSNTSFTEMSKVFEYDNLIEAHIVLFYSDFGSSHLNLWTILKTDKDVHFIETREYEELGP